MYKVKFIGNKIWFDGKEYPLGQITCLIAEGDTDWISTPITQITDWQLLGEKATEYLEHCFHSDDANEKIKGYLLCKANYPYPKQEYVITKEITEIETNGEIKLQIIDCYHIKKLIELIDLEMMYATNNNVSIDKCQNCGKYYATRKEGTMYCDRIFSDGRTCKQVSSKKIFNENLQNNELLSLYEKTYQAVYYKKRIAKTNKEIKRVDMFLKKLKTSRNDYRRDRISEDEFRTILAEYSADKV